MSLLTEASLVILPNAVEEGTLFSIIPADGSGDMDAVRATTATLVNSEGVIEDCPYNLLRRSQEFDNAIWSKINTTITTNSIIAPNGTLTSKTLTDNSTNNIHVCGNDGGSIGINTFSFYAKANTLTRVGLLTAAAVNVALASTAQVFDLSNGTIVNTISGVTATITNVGNGWYRCSVTLTALAGGTYFITCIKTGTNIGYIGSGENLYIWGAQLVKGTQPKEYFPTTDRLNVPRLDYTNGSCPSILVEPQRTNLLLRSQEFDNATIWPGTAGITRLANQTTAPDGTNTMDLLTFPVSGNSISQSVTTVSGATYTFSIWLATQSGTQSVEIGNINAGVYQSVTVTTTPKRFQITQVASSANRFPAVRATAAYSILLWGAQLEAGANATSYIPTVASSVTRNADVISKTGIADLIGQTEGVIFLDAIILPATSANLEILSLNDGTTNNRLRIITATSQRLRFISQLNGGIVQYDYTYGTAFTEQTRLKIAISYKSGNTAIYINGIKVNSSTNILTISNTLSVLNLGNNVGALYEAINSVALWKTALTDEQCISLTQL